MVDKYVIEQAIIQEYVMRMADEIKKNMVYVNDSELFKDAPDYIKDAPDNIKDVIREATPVALALSRIAELSRWN